MMLLALASSLLAQQPAAPARPRARDLGVPFEGTRGPLNAITDVAGVLVGHVTLISGSGPLVVGQGPVRTGVTAVLPRGRASGDPVMAGWFTLNGNGEMTGTTWVEENGFLKGPVMITNTHSVGVVRDAVIEWLVRRDRDLSDYDWSLPIVAETWDGTLNDINGFHVKRDHAFVALDGARGGPVAEGNVGGGTGMICHRFKGGIGTASRRVTIEDTSYTVGVLVQCNYGGRAQLRVAGVPVGTELPDQLPCYATRAALPPGERLPRCEGVGSGERGAGGSEQGSIIVVVATDAPLLPHQLKRVAKRVTLGIARMGGIGGDSSGDIFIAFSTANPGAATSSGHPSVTYVPNEEINPIFEATAQATEESIVNALVAAETMTGANDVRVTALPHDGLRAALQKYNRLAR
jgi:L-aminopeptidase/D-esterase-like protein